MSCMNGDEIIGVVENCAFHFAGWIRVVEEFVQWVIWKGGSMTEVR